MNSVMQKCDGRFQYWSSSLPKNAQREANKTKRKHIPTTLTYLLTYLLTPWSRVLEKLTGFQLVKKFPAFYVTRRFTTAFTRLRRLSLSWASSIQSTHPTSHFLKIYLNIILPSTPGPPKWFLSFRFPHQTPTILIQYEPTKCIFSKLII